MWKLQVPCVTSDLNDNTTHHQANSTTTHTMNPLFATPAILLLVYRAWSRKSLTPLGLVAAALTAVIHALHPSSIPFILLVAFYLAGTKATKVNHALKKLLTLSATGSEGGEGQRTHIQVLANSGVASALVLVQVFLVGANHWNKDGRCFSFSSGRWSDLTMIGIVGCVFVYHLHGSVC